jgi:hypothetical protein
MFGFLFKKNSIPKIVRVMPKALIDTFNKKDFYNPDEVKNVFDSKFKYDHNIKYAYAMFCSQADFEQISNKHDIELNYSDLRFDVSKKCFSSWPRFNFDSLLAYSQSSGVGFGGGEGGGDGGCGGGE